MNENDFALLNVGTGEIHSANISIPDKQFKYYIKKRLNMNIWAQGLSAYRHEVCSSILESRMFDYISYNLDRLNEFRGNQIQIAELHGTTQRTISKLITKMVKAGVLERIDRGVYRFNPFLIKATGCTNKDISELQIQWESKYGIPPKDIL